MVGANPPEVNQRFGRYIKCPIGFDRIILRCRQHFINFRLQADPFTSASQLRQFVYIAVRYVGIDHAVNRFQPGHTFINGGLRICALCGKRYRCVQN